MKIEEFRRKAREAMEQELIRDAMRARRFSSVETLLLGIDLIDFALKVKRSQNAKD